MKPLAKIICDNCGHANERNRGECDECQERIGYGYPNVNIYSDEYFTKGLQARYTAAEQHFQAGNITALSSAFANAVEQEGRAVINMDRRLFFTLANINEDYLPYRRAVEENKRLYASIYNDTKRTMIDSCFYGIHGADILFAALSLENNGLRNYGSVSLVLKEQAIRKRTTIFERNSFLLYDVLTREQTWNPADFPPPAGYFGVWKDRAKMALAKCKEKLTSDSDFSNLLLQNGESRDKDEFMELHIFGKISIFVSQTIVFREEITDAKLLVDLAITEEKLADRGIDLIQHG